MASLPVIVLALVPVAFVILLGVLAGRFGVIGRDGSRVLASLALDFCLPPLLFAATAAMPVTQLENWRFFLGVAIGLLATYAAALALALTAFRKTAAESSLQALNSAFPNMAFMGVPVLTAVIGKSAVLSVVIGNLVSSFVLLPLTLTLLEAGKWRTRGAADGKSGAAPGGTAGMGVVWKSLLGASRQPLVWAPLLRVAIAVLTLPAPEAAMRSLDLIGSATSGPLRAGPGAERAEAACRRGGSHERRLQDAGAAGRHGSARFPPRRDGYIPPRNDPARRPADRLDDGDVRSGI